MLQVVFNKPIILLYLILFKKICKENFYCIFSLAENDTTVYIHAENYKWPNAINLSKLSNCLWFNYTREMIVNIFYWIVTEIRLVFTTRSLLEVKLSGMIIKRLDQKFEDILPIYSSIDMYRCETKNQLKWMSRGSKATAADSKTKRKHYVILHCCFTQSFIKRILRNVRCEKNLIIDNITKL